MFDVQAIPDTMNAKLFGTCWPQELPVEHKVVL